MGAGSRQRRRERGLGAVVRTAGVGGEGARVHAEPRRGGAHHERRAGDVGREAERLGDILQRGDEVVVADDRQAPEHVEDAPHQHRDRQEHVVRVQEGVAHARLVLVERAPGGDAVVLTRLAAPDRARRPRHGDHGARSQHKLGRQLLQRRPAAVRPLPAPSGGTSW